MEWQRDGGVKRLKSASMGRYQPLAREQKMCMRMHGGVRRATKHLIGGNVHIVDARRNLLAWLDD